MDGIACGREIERERERERIHKIAEGVGKVNASYKEPYAVVVFGVHQQIFLLDGALRNSDQSKNAEMYRRQLQQRVGRLPTVLQRA